MAPTSRDAVIVVPGIMGSELVDAATGRTLWGLSDPRWYVRAWTSGSSLGALQLTDDEQKGIYKRVRATRLLRFPAFAPLLQGAEPYTRLLDGIRGVTVHADAVREFAYDWRLPVGHNAGLLANAAQQHLEAWRRHPAQLTARRADPNDSEATLVIAAHSMGGLLARHLNLIPGAADNVRMTVTIGAPFYGAVKAVMLLNSGRGAPVPLPRLRVRNLASTLPGVYDLLPMYRCVDTHSDVRRLSPADVADLGGDLDMAEASSRWHRKVSEVIPPGHLQIVGAHQPTLQSLTLANGIATGQLYTCRPTASGGIDRVNLAGDGTVARESAQLPFTSVTPLAQSHGAIAKMDETILVVSDAITDRRTGPWLGAGEIGIAVPDVVAVGDAFDVLISGIEHPRDASCRLLDVGTGRQVGLPRPVLADGQIVALAIVSAPGLYRVEVIGGGVSAVSQIVLACELSIRGQDDVNETH